MQEPGSNSQRFDITYFGGVNAAVQRMLAKRQEPVHAENARTGTIGSLEKRQGQAKYGTSEGGGIFLATNNYGLFNFQNDGANADLFRVTASSEPSSVLSITVYDSVYVIDPTIASAKVFDTLSPTVVVSQSSIGGLAVWTSAMNATAADGAYASTTLTTAPSLLAFNIVVGNTIVIINRFVSTSTVTSTSTYITQGGPTDLMGFTGTVTDVNSNGFGMAINLTSLIFPERGSEYLQATNFGFAIPGTATIQGFVAEAKISKTSGIAYNVDHLRLSVYYVEVPGGVVKIAANEAILHLKQVEYITVSEPTIFSRRDASAVILDGSSEAAAIWSLSPTLEWSNLSDPQAQNIIGAQFAAATVDTSVALVNLRDYNRMISSDGVTVTDSTQAGSLYNSPRASRVTFYKNRIYLADFFRSGLRNKTTIVRSSYPLGIIALLNGDYTNDPDGTTPTANWVIPVTDTKYFYADSGMNAYEVYRGPIKIATFTISAVNSSTITATNAAMFFEVGYDSFLSADEIWINGSYNGAKQYRWANNATTTGQDVKQYDTFKLVGGGQDPITILEPIGNVLLVANKNAFLTWNDFTLTNFDQGVGCVSQTGYTKLLGNLYFMSYSGVYTTNGTTPTLLSRKVERYIRGATKEGLESSSAGYKNLSVFFTLGDVTLTKEDGSYWKTLPDVCLEYNIADQNWFVHTNVNAKELQNYISSDGVEHLLMLHEGTEKSVKEFLVGNDDDGEVIFFRVDLPPIQLMREQELYATPIAISSESERGALMRCFVSLDGEDFYELKGDVNKGISILKVNSRDANITEPVMCHRIQLSYREGSTQLCRLIQTSVIYAPTTINPAP